MSQSPPIKPQISKEIKVLEIAVEICGKLSEDSIFRSVRANINKQVENGEKSTSVKRESQQSSPNEATFFNDDFFEILAEFKTIPSEEIYCRVSSGCVEIGAIHRETQGSGPNARHLDIQLTRLYQSPRAIDLAGVKCYLSSDGVLFVTGSYKEITLSQTQTDSKKGE